MPHSIIPPCSVPGLRRVDMKLSHLCRFFLLSNPHQGSVLYHWKNSHSCRKHSHYLRKVERLSSRLHSVVTPSLTPMIMKSNKRFQPLRAHTARIPNSAWEPPYWRLMELSYEVLTLKMHPMVGLLHKLSGVIVNQS
jgi:hypothetical protein